MTDTHHQQLEYYIKNKDYSTAESFLISIKSEYIDDMDYWYFLVHVNRKLGRLDKSEEVCQKAISKYPDSSQLNFELGIIYQTKGEYKKAIKYLEIVIQTKENISRTQIVDTLNSLALTYKLNGDTVNSLKNYNAALEILGQKVYEEIKNEPLQFTNLKGRDFNYTGEKEEGWVDLATRIAHKNAIKDRVRALRFPTGETAQKIVQDNPMMGVALHDDQEMNRYILPAYFSSFYLVLKSNLHYSNIYNNIGVLFAETGKPEEAKKCYEESIRFIPKGIEYTNPFINLEELGK
ncbi:MAG: tetratricopeptide repeat protein [Candidatus Paceibacterota bacterium]|jgi:tetratricopeptide (TPR) repeat protein